jgi:hypothetical protein
MNTHEAEDVLVQRNEQEPRARPQATHTRKGCSGAWLLLDCLHTEIRSVCNALEDCKGNKLSGYNRSAALSVCADLLQDELWENVNPGLDRILGFRRSQGEFVAMICHS